MGYFDWKVVDAGIGIGIVAIAALFRASGSSRIYYPADIALDIDDGGYNVNRWGPMLAAAVVVAFVAPGPPVAVVVA